MNAADQFHAGIVVDDLERGLADLSALFGYQWCPEMRLPTPVRLPSGETTIDLRFTYSTTTPRLEMIETIPGTLWAPAAGSGVHHLGYWSDDLEADSALLGERGYAMEASGWRPDGSAVWAYHRHRDGPRIELVERALQRDLEAYWSSGRS